MIDTLQSHQTPAALLKDPAQMAGRNATLAQLKEQADNFEAVIVKQMLDIAMQHEESLFGEDSAGSHIYRSMYHESLSQQVSGGFGYSELLFQFLQEKL